MAAVWPALSSDIPRYGIAALALDALTYRRNAFRLTGLSIDTGARDITRLGERLVMLHRLNGGTPAQGGFPGDPPPALDGIQEALQRLRDPEQRILDEFFWFWPVHDDGARSDQALSALAAGDADAAIAVWEQTLASPRTRGSAIHNLAVIEHLRALEAAAGMGAGSRSVDGTGWRKAYRRWAEVLQEEAVWIRLVSRIRVLDDPRVNADFARELREALPPAILAVNVALARDAASRGDQRDAALHAGIIRESGFSRLAIESSVRRLVEPYAARVASLCEDATTATHSNAKGGAKAASRLIEETKPMLAALDLLVSPGEKRREELRDEVANAALACLVRYANATEDWKTVIPLTESTEKIAATSELRARVSENLETAKGNLELRTCWFCKDRIPEERTALKIPMHGDIQREYHFLRGTQVRWRRHDIEVPRCATCAAAHQRIDSGTWSGVAFGFLAGFGGCFVTFDTSGFWALVVFVVCTVIGANVGKHMAESKVPSGVAPVSRGREFPVVLGFRNRGWEFGEKPANVN